MKTGNLPKNVSAAFNRRWLPKVLLASPFVFAAAFGVPQASAAPIATGTVMVSTGSGKVTEFTQTGTMLGQLNTTTSSFYMTGSMFDSAGNFFVTDFSTAAVTKFDPSGFLIGPFGSGYTVPESILHDASGIVYVGDVSNPILKFDPSGTKLASFTTATGRSDWIELGADQCTLYFTGEGQNVGTLNVCTNTAGPNFNVAPLPGGSAFALRLLPAGGMLVADSTAVIRLDAAGNQIKTYTLAGAGTLFALNLDPDATSFWTADTGGKVFKVDEASGTVLQSWTSSGVSGFTGTYGLSVKGEKTVVTGVCGSGDAVIVNKQFPIPGKMTYDISSPTRVLQSITLAASSNIGTSTLPTILTGGHSATGGVFIKANPAAPATFELLAAFVSPAFSCLIDPITTTLRINKGQMAEQAFHMIPKAEHFIDIENGNPGLNWIRIDVNGRPFTFRSLTPQSGPASGGTIRIDASAAMNLENNTLAFIGRGETGSFANINVSDSAPAASGSGLGTQSGKPLSPSANKKATSVQATGIWGRLMYEQ
jgi:streptogramin lyase